MKTTQPLSSAGMRATAYYLWRFFLTSSSRAGRKRAVQRPRICATPACPTTPLVSFTATVLAILVAALQLHHQSEAAVRHRRPRASANRLHHPPAHVGAAKPNEIALSETATQCEVCAAAPLSQGSLGAHTPLGYFACLHCCRCIATATLWCELHD